MAATSIITATSPAGKKLLDSLQSDLKNISNEAKRKHPPLKEAAEAGILKLRSASSRHHDLRQGLLTESPEILEPFFMACDTKQPKLVQIALTGIHRMITFEAVNHSAANNLVNCLWGLMENSIEEVRILQTVTLLVSTNTVIQGLPISKAIAVCFRLNFTKNQSTNNAASATVRQVVCVVFERVIRFMRNEASYPPSRNPFEDEGCNVLHEELKFGSRDPPKSLQSMGIVSDAFMLFQDLIQLVKAEQPFWLNGLTEMTRTFGLELLEMILSSFPEIFFKFEEFTFLLKEKICPIIIQLLSPNIKYKHQPLTNFNSSPSALSSSQLSSGATSLFPSDKPFYPISIRLLRILGVLLQKFHPLLMTESEIFLTILIKFLDADKVVWQRTASLEVLHKVMSHPNLLKSFCVSYDMKPYSSKILRDMISSLAIYLQSYFIPPADSSSGLLSSLIGSVASSNASSASLVPQEASASSPGFSFRSTFVPLVFTLKPGEIKSQHLDMLDKNEAPVIPDAYGVTTAYYCLLDIVKGLFRLIDIAAPTEENKSGQTWFSSTDSASSGPGSAVRASFSSTTSGSFSSAFNTSIKRDKVQELDAEVKAINQCLLMSSWPGLVASLTLFLETSNDSNITSNLLKITESFIGLLGVYNLTEGRNAFIVALCRSSLPSGPGFAALTYKLPQEVWESRDSEVSDGSGRHVRSLSVSTDVSTSSDAGIAIALSNNATLVQQMFYQVPIVPWPPLPAGTSIDSSDPRQQIVIRGSGLSPSSRGASTAIGPVLISVKHLLSMKSVLNVALNHGCILNESWHPVLLSLQHLVWILGLKPSTGGSLKSSRGDQGQTWELTSVPAANSSLTDVPVLTAMLSKLFSNSLQLDDEALSFLVESLIILSKESLELTEGNREPALFAVAKLLETGLVNLSRIDIIWKNLSQHLIHVCRHSNSKMREWGTETLTTLVVAAVSAPKGKIQSKEINADSKFRFLAPLQDLSDIPYHDLRQKQLSVCLQLIQSTGDRLDDAWPQILDIVASLQEAHTDSLIRLAFQCLQLIISDFMNNIPAVCFVLVVDTAAKFGSQTQELNVSLTGIGCLWNIADFLNQNQNKVRADLAKGSDASKTSSMESQLDPFECLWMTLFSRLGNLCCDSRPSVRKSAAQTLFSGLTTHAEILENAVWHSILWKVLFPLMDKVNSLMTEASDEKITDASKSMGVTGVGSSGNILLHHSRNTAYKQWAETQVLVLSGVCKVVSGRKELLSSTLSDFDQGWRMILRNIESAASLSKNTEVSQSALTCFQDLISTISMTKKSPVNLSPLPESFWLDALLSWCKIGEETTVSSDNQEIASQSFLTAFVRIFPNILCHIKTSFSKEQFLRLSVILKNILKIPVDSTTQAFLVTVTSAAVNQVSQESVSTSLSASSLPLTPLQESVFNIIESFSNDFIGKLGSKVSKDLLIPLFNLFLSLFSTSSGRRRSSKGNNVSIITPPTANSPLNINDRTIGSSSVDWMTVNYVPIADKSLKLTLSLYQYFAWDAIVMKEQVLHSIIRTIRTPLVLRFDCASPAIWKICIKFFISILETALPVVRSNGSEFVKIWADLALTLEEFLFPASKPPVNQTTEEQYMDEAYDVKVVELIRDSILPYASQTPKEFVLQVVSILNRGSIHSATTNSPIDMESNRKLREEFARVCFETLLQFSFLGPKGNPKLFIQNQSSSVASLPQGNNGLVHQTNKDAVKRPDLPQHDSGFCNNGMTPAEVSATCFNPEVGLVNRLAVTSLLLRFHEVIVKFIEDEKLSGKCPLARHRVSEMSFVLKALATLISSLKKAPKDTVEETVWLQLIDLYPYLVDCTTSSNFPALQVNRCLQEVLYEYKDLLHPFVSRGSKNLK